MQKQQEARYSDTELSLIKNTFRNNIDLLKSMRKVFLQLPVNAVDLASLELIKGEEVQKLLRRVFLPEIEANAPVGRGQIIDLWMTVQVADKLPDYVYQQLVARDKVITLIEQGLDRLAGNKVRGEIKINKLIDFKDKEVNELYTDFVARNTYINHTEHQLGELLFLSENEPKDRNELEKEMRQNSAE